MIELLLPSLLLLLLGIALALIASSPPKMPPPHDVFGFATMPKQDAAALPGIQYFQARDGEMLALRHYPSTSRTTLIFLHGSSYHGASYHAQAEHLSQHGLAKVLLPNLRGHYLSGPRRGDVDYVGQLEDDIGDLILWLREQDEIGPIILGGHSSGAGLAIRAAGGDYRALITGFLLLSPIVPTAPSTRPMRDVGWGIMHMKRLFGLLMLPLSELQALPVIAFNKPAQFRDGTETLSYSMRLNASYHPRIPYHHDLASLGPKVQMLVGSHDEAVDGERLHVLTAKHAPDAQVTILPEIDHFGIFTAPAALAAVAEAMAVLGT